MITRLQKSVKQYFKDNIGTIGVLLILCILLSMFPRTSGSFLTQKDISNVLRQMSSNLFLACGMTMVIIPGGTDLSAGSIIAPSSCSAVGCVSHYGLPIVAGVLGGVLVGTMVGTFNGAVTPKTTILPFIVTLVAMSMAKKLAYVYTGGSPIRVVTKKWQSLGAGYVGGVPTLVILLAVVLVTTATIINKTKLGRHIYVVGGNSQAIRSSGISTAKVRLLIHTYPGIMAGLAGVVLASCMYSNQPTAGDGTETDAIAAVMVGGTFMASGSGKIGGAIVGGLIIGALNNGPNLLNVNSFWQYAIGGTVILLTVFMDYLRNKKTEQSLIYGKSILRQ